MFSLSLKKSAPLAILLPLLTSVGLLGFIGFENGRRTADKLANQRMIGLSRQIDERVKGLLHQPILINTTNIDAIRLGQLNLQNPNNLERHFWHQMKLYKNVNGIQFGYEETGKLRGLIREREEEEEKLGFDIVDANSNNVNTLYKYDVEGEGYRSKNEPKKFSGYDTKKRLWYTTAVKAGELTWTEIFKKKSAKTVQLRVSAVQPVYENDKKKLIGVFSVDFFLSQISEFLKEIKKIESGNLLIFIVDKDGNLVASSTESPDKPVFQDIKEDSQKVKRILASASQDELIKATSMQIEKQYQSGFGGIPKKETSLKLEKGVSEPYRVQIKRFEKENLNWSLVVVVPEKFFMQDVQKTRDITVILALVTIGFSIGLGLVVTRWLINPILQLNDAANKIVSNEFDLNSLDPITKRTDELGQLATVFQEMAQVVYTREKSLKQQVEDLRSETDKAKKSALAKQLAGNIDVQALLTRSQKARQGDSESNSNFDNFREVVNQEGR
jgi:methyl-accepting chemotaxis protein